MNDRVKAAIEQVTPPILIRAYSALKRALGINSYPGLHRLKSGATYYTGQGVGGKWDTLGRLQFEFLVEMGLKPHHRLLDIGCGSLRGGIHFVRYLDDGNYYGMDMERYLLDAAVEVELPRYDLADRTVHLACGDEFDFSVFGQTFDVALAQSVFSHLSRNSVLRALLNVAEVLTDDGFLYATFYEDGEGNHRTSSMRHEPGGRITHPDRDPFHYNFATIESLAEEAGLNVEYHGDWGHPQNQKMARFTKKVEDMQGRPTEGTNEPRGPVGR